LWQTNLNQFFSRRKTRPLSLSIVSLKALASADASLIVALLARLPTKPARPDRLIAGPCCPLRNENVVAQVGHAILGKSSGLSPNAGSVTISPLNKSNAHRGQSP